MSVRTGGSRTKGAQTTASIDRLIGVFMAFAIAILSRADWARLALADVLTTAGYRLAKWIDPEGILFEFDEQNKTVAGNSIANYALGLLIALIVLLVAALVGGEFAASIPTGNPFHTAIQTTIDTAGTAFTIFGVTLIVLPGVAAVVVIVSGLGGMMGR